MLSPGRRVGSTNALWLAEALTERVALRPGMRVLDLGCGRALSSVFLAREFGAQVWATDLWINPSENWERIREAGCEGSVFPIYAEARSLPYARGFFDAILSVDAYHYFGTDDLYLQYVVRFLRPGGLIGIACPAWRNEFQGEVPEHLRAMYHDDWHSFHSPQWWRRHWEKTRLVVVTRAEMLEGGHEHWLAWEELKGTPEDDPELRLLREDRGENVGFSMVMAERCGPL